MTGKIDNALNTVDGLLEDGYNGYDIINVISRVIQDSNQIEEEFKYDLLKEVSIVKMKVLEGIDSEAQLYGFFANVCEMCIMNVSALKLNNK
jgi:DNA polymerase III delta prime subunit